MSMFFGDWIGALRVVIEPTWIAKAIATGFLLIAIFIFISSERRATSIISRLESHQVTALKPVRIMFLTWALVLATVALIIAFWTLADQ